MRSSRSTDIKTGRAGLFEKPGQSEAGVWRRIGSTRSRPALSEKLENVLREDPIVGDESIRLEDMGSCWLIFLERSEPSGIVFHGWKAAVWASFN